MSVARKLRRVAAIAATALALGLGAFAAAPAQAHGTTPPTSVAVRTAAVLTASSPTGRSETVRPDILPIPLVYGDTGSAVKLWQQDLNAYINTPPLSCRPTLALDGVFGQYTYNATVCFQGEQGITKDGEVGTQTRGAMCSFLSRFGFTSLYQQTCL